jgi:glycosyltransferase involved in cell wall biosynthesis
MPLAILEAFACGVPTIATRLGGMREMIDDGHNGLLVAPGDSAGIATRVRWLFDSESESAELSRAARTEYEAHHTAAANCTQLIDIYQQAIEQSGAQAT